MFTGFDTGLLTFLKALAKNNSKDWFDAHRGDYDQYFKSAAQDFVADISGEMSKLGLQAIPKVNGSLRRINRDIRFSKDKTPYHTHMHLVFWAGDHPNRSAGMHVIIGADGLGYGAGHFGMTPDILATYRAAVADNHKRDDLRAALEMAAQVGATLEAPHLARLPRGFTADDSWEHLLRYKSLVARTQKPQPMPQWITTPDITPEILTLTQAHLPLINWLNDLG